MTRIPTIPPLVSEIHPDITNRLDLLERTQTEHTTLIEHYRAVALAANEAVAELRKGMKATPYQGKGALVRNIATVSGLISLGIGCWWIMPAVSLIVIGSISLGLVLCGTIAHRKLEREYVRPDN